MDSTTNATFPAVDDIDELADFDMLQFLDTQDDWPLLPNLPAATTLLPIFPPAEENYANVRVNRWLDSFNEASHAKYSFGFSSFHN